LLVYVIRHGQTDWNAEQRLQGQKDIPLNDLGRSQATGNGRLLKAILGEKIHQFDYVASPLSRTRETMELMRSAMGLDPKAYRLDPRLVEVSFGDWEGFTIPEVEVDFPDRLADRRQSKWSFIPPGESAESYEILSWRIAAWLSTVQEPTICVCHGGVIRAIFKLIAELEDNEAADCQIPQDQLLRVDLEARRVEWIVAE
jgi:broad specificity phosphatase PhoE